MRLAGDPDKLFLHHCLLLHR